uniref:Uncharacterized protein n=1 Tax=Triticum urartu TaxID=4572 RepID=A0A8R7TNT7_TRIUA
MTVLSLPRSSLLGHRRGSRKLLCALGDAATDVGLGLGCPVDGPERVVPAAEAGLVLERLHSAHAHRHHPRRLGRTCHIFLLDALEDDAAEWPA